jgi:hypothetical protein
MFADRLRYLEIELSPWLFRAIEACEVLPISRSYFRLRRPLDRRIYELARKHCGQQNHWRVSIEVLQKKSGSYSPAKKFAFYIRHLTAMKRAIAHPWAAFSSGSSFWLFTGTVSVARSRLIKSPVLQVNSYTEDGVLIDAGLWSAGCDGQWHRLDTSEVLRMQDNDR